ncbi:MAG TPA: glycosyltransferase, partial [Anaerolinea sp.]|nr:glycosyltransferase [Anaerolinea sp.]
MKITLLALGSTGDVLPCAALGGALVEAGHRVRLASFEHFRPIALKHGLSFSPVAGDVKAMLRAGGTHMPRVLFQFMNRANAYVRDFSAPDLLDADLILNQLPGG